MHALRSIVTVASQMLTTRAQFRMQQLGARDDSELLAIGTRVPLPRINFIFRFDWNSGATCVVVRQSCIAQ